MPFGYTADAEDRQQALERQMLSPSGMLAGLGGGAMPVTHLCTVASPLPRSTCHWHGTAAAAGPPGSTRGCSSAPPVLRTHSGTPTPASRWHAPRAGLRCLGMWPLERNTVCVITLFWRVRPGLLSMVRALPRRKDALIWHSRLSLPPTEPHRSDLGCPMQSTASW